jgi:PAS domain S-box-containing protein
MGQEPTIVTTEQAHEADDTRRSALGRVLAQQAAVAEVAQRALDSRDLRQLLNEVCVLAGRVLESDLVDVLELSDDGSTLRIVAGVGWRPGVIGHVTLPAQGGSQSGYTLAKGGPVIADDFESETRFQISQVLADHGARSGIAVRIGSADEPFGVLASFSARRSAFNHEDAAFMQSMANVLGSAIARLRAEDELRRSRDEMATIVSNVADGIFVQSPTRGLVFANDAAARLCGFDTAAELMATPWQQMMSAFELLDEDGRPMAEDRLPTQVAIRTGRPTEPTPVRFRIRDSGEERWSLVQAAPVLDARGSVVQAVSVFRDVTDEHRREVMREIIAEAAGSLTSTLSVDEASHRLASLCVPRLADFATVELLDADGAIRTAAIAHADQAKVALGHRLRELRPVRPDDAGGPGRVARESTSELVEMTEEILRAALSEGEELDLLLGLGVRWYICVPLIGRGGPIGALTLVQADSGRRFSEPDLRLAEELGSRAGITLENARLYEDVDERRAELEAVIGAMGEAVLVFDASGRLRVSNRAAARLFGGHTPTTMIEVDERLEGDQPHVDQLEGQHRIEATGRWVEAHVYRPRLKDAGLVAAGSSVVVLRDITDARTAQVAREAFIGVLSHELRTPITTIYGGSELLVRGLSDPQRSEIVADIRAESERLARLVEDLLVMSRVERGGLEIGDEPVLIQRMLPGLLALLAARWPSLRVTTNMADGLPAVRGDVTYLEQVLRNLLVNAVRYGDALAKGVEIAVHEDDGGQVIVRVLDQGPGPGTDVPERLFELFYRAPKARSVPGGAGIGLFVCRQLVEAMGGRLWAKPRDGGGTEFGFHLPVVDADASA